MSKYDLVGYKYIQKEIFNFIIHKNLNDDGKAKFSF